jgi:hypothetical protein
MIMQDLRGIGADPSEPAHTYFQGTFFALDDRLGAWALLHHKQPLQRQLIDPSSLIEPRHVPPRLVQSLQESHFQGSPQAIFRQPATNLASGWLTNNERRAADYKAVAMLFLLT